MDIVGVIKSGFQAVTEFFKKLPMISGWFRDSTAENVEERQDDTDDEMDDYQETGRPQWDR